MSSGELRGREVSSGELRGRVVEVGEVMPAGNKGTPRFELGQTPSKGAVLPLDNVPHPLPPELPYSLASPEHACCLCTVGNTDAVY